MKKASIHLSEQFNHICLKCTLGKKSKHSFFAPDKFDKFDHDILTNWILFKTKHFWGEMPIDISIHVFPSFFEKHKKSINQIGSVFGSTKLFIEKLEKDSNANFDGLLFINVSEDLRYKSLYEIIKKESKNVNYLNLDLGFDREKRKWIGAQAPMTIDQLISFLAEKRIGKIITINNYFIDKYQALTSINLISVFNYLGIDFVIIDNDPPDLRPYGYLRKAAMNNPKIPRFSNMGYLNEYWDKKFGLSNVKYCAIPQNYDENEWRKLDDNYRIVVLSNSRWESVKNMLAPIEAILACMANPWKELSLWYLSLRQIILDLDLPLSEKLRANSLLHQFYFTAAQKIKFDIVKSIKTERIIEVYGDIGWKNVCPEYYVKSLQNNEINGLFNRKNDLFLLLNFSLTYLDASGPVYDMFRRKVPFINIPPVAKTERFMDMCEFEYSSSDDLNLLISNAQILDWRYAWPVLAEYDLCVENMIQIIKGYDIYDSWQDEFNDHKKVLNKTIREYTSKNDAMLFSCLKIFGL